MQIPEDWDVLVLVKGLEIYLLQGVFIQRLNKRKQETAGHFRVPRKLPQGVACASQVPPQKGSRFCPEPSCPSSRMPLGEGVGAGLHVQLLEPDTIAFQFS